MGVIGRCWGISQVDEVEIGDIDAGFHCWVGWGEGEGAAIHAQLSLRQTSESSVCGKAFTGCHDLGGVLGCLERGQDVHCVTGEVLEEGVFAAFAEWLCQFWHAIDNGVSLLRNQRSTAWLTCTAMVPSDRSCGIKSLQRADRSRRVAGDGAVSGRDGRPAHGGGD